MFKKNRGRIAALTAAVLCLGINVSTLADSHGESAEVKIARAMMAAPPDISAKATIVDVDGTVLREGTNGWTCIPGVGLIPGDKHPMCNDATWMAWMKAIGAGEEFSTDVIGVSYMLAGDAYVNNDDPNATDPNDGGNWVQEGPHLMLLMPSTSHLAGLPRDPFVGGPYVMWADTPLVHVMVPVGERPEQP